MREPYVTQEGEMLDAIAYRQYGVVDGALEAILAANPHLEELPVKLPSKVVITLPDLPVTTARLTRLWDV